MAKPRPIVHSATAEAALAAEPLCRVCRRKKIVREARRVVAADGNPSNQASGNLQPVCAVHAEELSGSAFFLEAAA